MESEQSRMAVIRTIWEFILDTIFPIECIGCDKEKEWICDGCVSSIPVKENNVCFVCKQVAQGGKTCFSCMGDFCLSGVMSFTNYKNPLITKTLHLVKYQYVASALNPILNKFIPLINYKFDQIDIDPRVFIFVPVPLHPRRKRMRGFNQAEIVANAFAKECGAPVKNILLRTKMRTPQAELDKDDRALNLQGIFKCIDKDFVKGKYICLIDDVATTGTTLNECARVLVDAGAVEVWGIVLAG